MSELGLRGQWMEFIINDPDYPNVMPPFGVEVELRSENEDFTRYGVYIRSLNNWTHAFKTDPHRPNALGLDNFYFVWQWRYPAHDAPDSTLADCRKWE